MNAFAAFLSLLVPGLGQLCQGRLMDAIGHLLVGLVIQMPVVILAVSAHPVFAIALVVWPVYSALNAAHYTPKPAQRGGWSGGPIP